mmetsp:Transcript_4302/g.11018  ORF Transcript_4302/g.11018 Transcript_4302/m.11018 type:complete len:301 (-) Transcript_4302:800-1702(-)
MALAVESAVIPPRDELKAMAPHKEAAKATVVAEARRPPKGGGSPAKKKEAELPKKKRGGRGQSRRKGGEAGTTAAKAGSGSSDSADGGEAALVTPPQQGDSSRTTFDCSTAIAQVAESVWVSAVSGTRLGASLEAALLEEGVTAIVSLEKNRTETFEMHCVDPDTDDRVRRLHDACDFMSEAISDGGAVFVHSKSGFARSEGAVRVVLGYLVKYHNAKLADALETVGDHAKHALALPGDVRADLVTFEAEVLGESSVPDDWILADDAGSTHGTKNHSLSRRKLAENLNDRRLLKKKSPHK